MSNLFYQYFFVATLFLVFGCTKGAKVVTSSSLNEGVIGVGFDELGDFVLEEDLFSQVALVGVELPDSIKVGSIDNVQYVNNRFYLKDKLTQSIIILDSGFNYQNYLSFRGTGPTEYNEIFNFIIRDGKIIINDLLKVCYYDENSLDFLFSRTKKLLGFRTYVVGTSTVLNYQLNTPLDTLNNNVILYDLTSDELLYLGSEITDDLKGFTFSQENHAFENRGKMLFVEAFNDTIYMVSDNGIEPFRYVDFGNIKLTKHDLEENVPISSSSVLASGKAYFLGEYLENDSLVTFTFTLNGKRYRFIYNKKSENRMTYSSLKQSRTPFIIPRVINEVMDESLISWKDKEELRLELNQIRNRMGTKMNKRNLKSLFDSYDSLIDSNELFLVRQYLNF